MTIRPPPPGVRHTSTTDPFTVSQVAVAGQGAGITGTKSLQVV